MEHANTSSKVNQDARGEPHFQVVEFRVILATLELGELDR